jgi:hypothetical protein
MLNVVMLRVVAPRKSFITLVPGGALQAVADAADDDDNGQSSETGENHNHRPRNCKKEMFNLVLARLG